MTTTRPLSERLSNTDATSDEIEEVRQLEAQRDRLLKVCQTIDGDLWLVFEMQRQTGRVDNLWPLLARLQDLAHRAHRPEEDESAAIAQAKGTP